MEQNKLSNDTISVSNFINTKYRSYWEYSNKNGKNAISPKEQLPEVVRKIIYAAYQLNMKDREERKTVELSGETAKYHAHGDSSIQDSIKGVATAYKSQPATRLLRGIGNFGYAPGDDGAAARYTSIERTPLLATIFKDIPFMPFNTDDTGLEQPEYISTPLPLTLINGASQIGTGKSCYVAERDAKEVIKWIDELNKANWKEDGIEEPKPMSVTGCKTWFEPSNGYIYYEANVHYAVDINDLNKRGKYDVITALPPKSNAMNTISKLINKLPTRVSKHVIDGSGKGRSVYIILPTGYLNDADFNKYGMRSARKEQIYIWDYELNTMRFASLTDVAHLWFEDRCKIVTKRLSKQVTDLESINKRIDLIKEFAENKMINWKSEDVIAHFVKLAGDQEEGEKDASIVLSQSARTFLPENLDKNSILKEKNIKEIKNLNKRIKNVGDEVIKEAYEIIEAQEKFFNED